MYIYVYIYMLVCILYRLIIVFINYENYKCINAARRTLRYVSIATVRDG